VLTSKKCSKIGRFTIQKGSSVPCCDMPVSLLILQLERWAAPRLCS